MHRDVQALALLQPFFETEKAFFEAPARAALVKRMRTRGAQVVRAEAAAEHLREMIDEVRRWGNLRPLDDPDAASALERQLRHAAGVIAKVSKVRQRETLVRHIERFLVPRGRARGPREGDEAHTATTKLDINGLLDDVARHEAARADPTIPLPIDDPEQVEVRRMAQLDLLRRRSALNLLDTLHAGLAWLALHQGADGRLSDGAALAYCQTAYADDAKSLAASRGFLRSGGERYAVSTTSLALMAFLDFRDQDGRGLFEPTIARATAWLRGQQDPRGFFSKGGRAFYSDAIALMALAQAAGATGDLALKQAVARGLAALYALQGPGGGYRYGAKQAGDLSVSGWVTQAVEYAEGAGIDVPDGMREGLRLFLDSVWSGGARFAYTSEAARRSRRGSPSLYPVGMLMTRVLRPKVRGADRDAWARWLASGVGRRAPGLYTLYYGVRMDVWVHGLLSTKWRDWLNALARRQERTGPVAGAFRGTGRTSRAGPTLSTGLALLTMEHALFSR